MGLVWEPLSWAICRVLMEWLFVSGSESYKMMMEGGREVDKRRMVWEAEDGAGREEIPPGHSPLAQKTPILLESENGTFKTSLWLSKSSSGPSQLSTIGAMSCRSGERGAHETILLHPTPSPWTTPYTPSVAHHPVMSAGCW